MIYEEPVMEIINLKKEEIFTLTSSGGEDPKDSEDYKGQSLL